MDRPTGQFEFNTFTVLARCPNSGLLGLAIASSPLSVAARCPIIAGGLAVVSSQAHTNPRLGTIAIDLLRAGFSPEDVLIALERHDRWFEWRQIGIVTQDGRVAVASGRLGKPHTGHITGDGFICMGNALSGPAVIEEMHRAYLANADQTFEERLVRALEAGRDAGGESVGHLSAGLQVAGPDDRRPRTDLRVDMSNPTPDEGGDAVVDLRRLFDAYKPLIEYYASYWPEHPEMNWRDWLKRGHP